MTDAEKIKQWLDLYEKRKIPVETMPTSKLIALCRELFNHVEDDYLSGDGGFETLARAAEIVGER